MSWTRRFFKVSDCENEPGSSYENVPPGCPDGDFSHCTKIKSTPQERLTHVLPGKATSLPVSPVKMLLARECNYSGRGRFSNSDSCHVLSRYLPTGGPFKIDTLSSCAYVSQFSADGSLFVAGFQESHIRVYNVDMDWKVKKDILAKNLRWTITDTCLSPDRRFLVYSSITPVVYIVDVGSGTRDSQANVTEIHEGLEFLSDGDDYGDNSFGIFSVKFSTDGREIVAASSDASIYVYDLESRRQSLRIPAHSSDVNAVCFADETGNVIYSGSDDHLCKVWDRRCFVSRGQAAGVLMGHLEGITFIDSRGDGRYFISNGKDQAIKLWDVRKMSSNVNYVFKRQPLEWDYRWMDFPEHAKKICHPDDISIGTYRGHKVLRTLIRCYFSPEYSTGRRYIYTGSTDGSVFIYDVLTGQQVAKLDYHEDPVRDCNWHPYCPMLVSSSWDGILAAWQPGQRDNPVPVKRTRRRRRFFY